MYFKKSVKRAEGNPGLPIQMRDSVTLLDVDDIAFFPPRDDKGIVIPEDIIMKPGRYGITVYGTPGTFAITSNAEGDPDQVGFQPQLVFRHPGNGQEVREFKQNSTNRKFIVIARYCSGKDADIIGTPCNPCRMTTAYTGNNESNANEFTFAQISPGDEIGIYRGSIPEEEPVAVVDASAKTVDFVAEGQYQLSAGEAVIDSIEGGAHGALVTLLGVAGVAPSVSPSEGILLRRGKPFVASDGAQITLRAFESEEGKLVWIEQSRYTPA